MKYNIVNSLSDPTIESKVELITYLIERLHEQQSNEIFERDIRMFLIEKENVSYHPYYLIGQKYSLGCLIAHFINNYIGVEDLNLQIELLKELLHKVKGFRPSPNPLLKKTTTLKLIDILTGLKIDRFFRNELNRPLRIYFIPFDHTEVNAYYYPQLNSIASFRPKNDGGTPEYIFMHEIGHLVAHRITGDFLKIPDSFIEFSNSLRPGSKADLIEVFADLFSVAVMMDTELASKHPALPWIKASELKLIKDYFTQLISTELLIKV
jgi:hypothetical protein